MEIQKLLAPFLQQSELDEFNLRYFMKLMELKFSKGGQHSMEMITQGEFSKRDLLPGKVYAVPTAVMEEKLFLDFPVINYEQILNDKDLDLNFAAETHLWMRPMQAGSGSTIERLEHLEKNSGKKRAGSKGTDLFVQLNRENSPMCPLAELQILRAIYLAEKQHFKEVIFQDVVGPETVEAVRDIWERPSLVDPGFSYEEFALKMKGLRHFKQELFQAYFPTFEAEGKLNFENLAPAGHAYFALVAFFAAVEPSLRPDVGDEPLVGVLSNGEDLSALPDPVMVAYMRQHKIPVMMVTTDKTSTDLKGGQLSFMLELDSTGENIQQHLGILEKAQADSLNLGEVFKQLGLRDGDRPGLFNTNMVLFNYEQLIPLMRNCLKMMDKGIDALWDICVPDLIQNKKQNKGKVYWQLEGALGSVVLNVDKFWRKNFGTSLVQILNVSKTNRSKFFSPIKTAFDFYVQFHSDRFHFDSQKVVLQDLKEEGGGGALVELNHPALQNVENVLRCFKNCKIIDLEKLKVSEGLVNFSHMDLKGEIVVESKFAGEFLLRDHLPSSILQDVEVKIDQQGRIDLRPLL